MRVIFETRTIREHVGYVGANGSVYCPEHRPDESDRCDASNLVPDECRVCGKPIEEFDPELVSGIAAIEFFPGAKIF